MTDLAIPSAKAAGQSTQIEQARALAEVQAMVAMARANPRVVSRAVDRMRDACAHLSLARRAFYRFDRGGQQVSGPSIKLARELALCWGNIDYSVRELYRNDYTHESEMLAYAWDLENTVRTSSGFIVPHKRDAAGQVKLITSMRDIYENNANNGARRLREAIFGVLPFWFCEEAEELCRKTLEETDKHIPLHKRVENMIAWYRTINVSEKQLVDKIGKPEGHWTTGDLATLTVVWESLKAKETTVELEFPTVFTRAEDVVGPQLGISTAEATANAEANAESIRQAVQPKPWTSPSVDVDRNMDGPTEPPDDYVCEVCQNDEQYSPHFQDECPRLGNESAD